MTVGVGFDLLYNSFTLITPWILLLFVVNRTIDHNKLRRKNHCLPIVSRSKSHRNGTNRIINHCETHHKPVRPWSCMVALWWCCDLAMMLWPCEVVRGRARSIVIGEVLVYILVKDLNLGCKRQERSLT